METTVPTTGGFCPYVCAHDILVWKNTITTSCVLAAIDTFFIVFWVFKWSLISLSSVIGLIGMGLGFVASVVLDKSLNDNAKVEIVSKERVEEHLVVIYNVVNKTATELRSLFLWRNHGSSVRACLFMALLAYISSWFSFITILFLGINTLFFFDHLCTGYEKFAAPHVRHLMELIKTQLNQIPRMAKTQHAKVN